MKKMSNDLEADEKKNTLKDISSEDEEIIINNAMHEAETGEVGRVDISEFESMIERYIH